jgi:indole-3-glycerol phosphate synthase
VDVLTQICSEKKIWVADSKNNFSESELLRRMQFRKPVRKFRTALTDAVTQSSVALIAELKKASPSKGLIRANFNAEELSLDYETGGATCLSILTDEPFFQGKDDYLVQGRAATSLPVLRKDFIIDSYQVLESRFIGADCVLLIMAAIEDSQGQELTSCAEELDMDVLVEIHDEAELERALRIKGEFLIGINNRNLKTLEVDLANTARLAPQIPESYEVICESGISDSNDIKRIQESGVQRFLVGETLMRKKNLVEATRKLLGLGLPPSLTPSGKARV